MTKLKPCPFCGGEAKIIQGSLYYGYRVGCENRWCLMHPITFSYQTKEEAIKAWNKRADDAYSDDGK